MAAIKQIRILNGIFSILFLISGIFIYLLFRNMNNLLFIELVPKLEFTKTVFIQFPESIFSNILLYNFPDMFWFISGILLLRFIWYKKFKEQKVYILCFYLFGAIFEISQLSENIPGTFDFLDLFFMCIGAFVEGLLYKNFIRRRLR